MVTWQLMPPKPMPETPARTTSSTASDFSLRDSVNAVGFLLEYRIWVCKSSSRGDYTPVNSHYCLNEPSDA